MAAIDELIIVTGGPGAGKSTLVAALAATGVRTLPEGGRAIIRDQQVIGGPALPWQDRLAFAEQMLGWELRSWHLAREAASPVVLDRGLPDIVGYLRLNGLAVPAAIARAATLFRYHRRVFLAPHWPAIYHGDSERRQDEGEARATCEVMRRVYPEFGYEVVELPLAPVGTRARFIAGQLGWAT